VLVADASEDPDDSSNERFGERRYSCAYKPGGNDGNAGGDADRELGRGMSAGVGGSAIEGTTVDEDADCRCALELRRGRESGFGPETGTGRSLEAEPEPARTRALLVGLEDGLGADGRS
jgi:hypothetical protein